jgi:hypothetical protein
MSYLMFLQAHPELEHESEEWKQQCYSDYIESLNEAVNQMEEDSY